VVSTTKIPNFSVPFMKSNFAGHILKDFEKTDRALA